MTKILITGGAGFIAPHIIEESINKGWEVVAVDLKEVPENLKFKEAKYLIKDVRDLDKTDLDNVDYIFLGAWNFKDEIFKKEKKFLKKGGKFITHVPFPKII